MIIKYKLINEWGDAKAQDNSRHAPGTTYDDKRAFEIYKTISSNIRQVQNTNVVDIGGSEGRNLKYFLADNSCFVVDYEKRDLIDGAKYLCETAEDIPHSFRFATVLYCHILEHVVDPVGEISRLKEILEPDGILYIEVPFGCWKEYQYTTNFLTHINFFSEGSLWHLLDMCGLNIKYLKVRPTLIRTGYSPNVIVAIAENSPPHNRKVKGYKITRKQMQGVHFFLRLYAALLNLRLTKGKFLAKILKGFIQARIMGKG
jgi:SAM-dependent methyltransferase